LRNAAIDNAIQASRSTSARVTYVGHATVLVELDGVRLLTDPVLRRRVLHLRRDGETGERPLHDLDAVLISHAHWDHLDIPSLSSLGRNTRVVVPRGAARILRRRRFADVIEVDAGETVEIEGIVVRATHAEHDAGRGPLGARAPALGYVVTGSRRVYFAGDTDLFPGMAELAPLDLALLPVAGWGPRLPPGHLDARRAAEALRLLQPATAVPIHWGTYAPITKRRTSAADRREPADEFARLAAQCAPAVAVHVLAAGESLELD
jgi:L-ascorbate metabolism protein UlaG (beta-lactamase superfamily)